MTPLRYIFSIKQLTGKCKGITSTGKFYVAIKQMFSQPSTFSTSRTGAFSLFFPRSVDGFRQNDKSSESCSKHPACIKR